ncbi:hypothetical protein B0T10DRAFT_283491 [Thelonectria olida]|uniref:Uncharacterized protein n=1 Tax=Thelonectria olida TaxID=1576542 RepID=A0A9P9ARU7_9HYPO|nr:hypothetical protein B0T10DRAFT_283491 [Thelonectria olida]
MVPSSSSSSSSSSPSRLRDEGINTVKQETSPCSITSQLANECVVAFKIYLKRQKIRKEIPQKAFSRLEASYCSLVLWNNGYGVGDGKLDYLLTR